MCSKEVNKMAATAGTPIKTTASATSEAIDARSTTAQPRPGRSQDHTTAGQKLFELPVRESPAMLVADGDR